MFLFDASVAAIAESSIVIEDLWRDHAVVQRDRPITIAGRANAGDQVTATLNGQSAAVVSDATGHWTLSLPAMSAGGPYSLDVKSSSGALQTISDILIGDVWLCSGQSNMAMTVSGSLDARSEIAGSANDSIRMATIDLASNPTPLESLKTPIQWKPAGPQTVGDFSAACFYFARELQKQVTVPMGLITSAWGGSKIEAWMSEAALRSVGGYDASLAMLKTYATDPAAAGRQWGSAWETWWRAHAPPANGREPWREPMTSSAGWRKAPAALGPWEKWGVPELQSYNGLLWYRTSFTLTPKQAKQTAALSLGPVDEVDDTWMNGVHVGNGSGAGRDRHYKLPLGALRSGVNTLVVNALDTYALGGMLGGPEKRNLQLADGTVIPLNGEWQYQIPPANLGPAPRAPWEDTAGLTIIRNAMIEPLGAYGLRGVLWYQGESNTETAANYRQLLAAWMADWRKQFGADLSFLIVQLANYGSPPTQPDESGWAEVREAERAAAAADAHAGLAVAIDIGESYDIHPRNKQELGRRLARAARKVMYGENIAPSGPVARNARRDGENIVVSFGDVAKALIAYSSDHPIGFELCGAAAHSCRYSTATINGDRVTLDGSVLPSATRVRYCWADSPVCTLFDRDVLPAGPFELAIQRQ
jgi:sialate O-acetylesterase